MGGHALIRRRAKGSLSICPLPSGLAAAVRRHGAARPGQDRYPPSFSPGAPIQSQKDGQSECRHRMQTCRLIITCNMAYAPSFSNTQQPMSD